MKKALFAAVLGLSLAGIAHADDSAEDVYMAKCKGCHGTDGKADTKIGHSAKIADMTSAKWQGEESDEDIRKIIADGSPKKGSKMKAFKDKLSAGEIDALVKYIRAMKK